MLFLRSESGKIIVCLTLIYGCASKEPLLNQSCYRRQKKCGVSTPTIYEIDMKKTTIVMEYIEGDRVKELLNNELNEDKKVICRKIGESLGKLHKNGIIHGDPTTSNFIYTHGKVFFVDFGLGVFSDSLEDASVDLHLLKR
ncbi:MAG: lipopolysaccharide core heptose(II) kinase RfaY, partial [Asgard group archaeon]